MSEENPAVVGNNNQVVETSGRRWSTQDWVAIGGITLTLAGVVWGGYAAIRSDITSVRNEIITNRGEVALISLRVNNLESKAQVYDRIMEQRTVQLGDINAKLARIEEFMRNAESQQANNRREK